MKILTIVGARPQFIKAAAVTRELAQGYNVKEVLVHTGQHYDEQMSAVFFDELGLTAPDYQLEVGSASHGAQTGRMLERLEPVVEEENPDCVLVYGDTNSTLAGALVAAKLKVPVAHVEAGLRSFNMAMPEEINRILTDRISRLLFCPTQAAMDNLAKEHLTFGEAILVGDVMYDSALYVANQIDSAKALARWGVEDKSFVLVTIHRAENTDNDERLREIVRNLVDLSRQEPVLLPLHPRTRAALDRLGLLNELRSSVQCIAPLGYMDMIAAEKSASLVITDSGGVQKEAFFARTNCLVVRTETEWVELTEAGCAQLVEPDKIALQAMETPRQFADVDSDLYGGGHASSRIVQTLTEVF